MKDFTPVGLFLGFLLVLYAWGYFIGNKSVETPAEPAPIVVMGNDLEDSPRCLERFENWYDLDCDDFRDWYDAQEEYDESIGCLGEDVNFLDGDYDGVACENLREYQ